MNYLNYTFCKKTLKDTKKIQFAGKAGCILENIKKSDSHYLSDSSCTRIFRKIGFYQEFIVL